MIKLRGHTISLHIPELEGAFSDRIVDVAITSPFLFLAGPVETSTPFLLQ
jgi:hypothetical protein